MEIRRDVSNIVLRRVRVGQHEHFDRVVFDFEVGSIPSYKLEYSNNSGVSGEDEEVPLAVAGNIFLHINLFGVQAHSDSGDVVVNPEGLIDYLSLKEVVEAGDFEGQVNYVLGVDSFKPYRVQELLNPTRIAVDIKH